MRSLPNILTLFRIFLTVLLLAFFLYPNTLSQAFRLDAFIDFNQSLSLIDAIGIHTPWNEYFVFDKHSFIGFLIFTFASITDFFDGYIARRFNLTSTFGEVFDPLADKMLMLSCFISLLLLHKANPWAIFLILSREFFITGLRVVAASEKISIKASSLGKAKTIVQMIAIGFLLLDMHLKDELLWIAVGITVYSGAHYAYSYYKHIKLTNKTIF